MDRKIVFTFIKYGIYWGAFVIIVIIRSFKEMDVNLVYTLFMAYILLLFMYEFVTQTKNYKKTEKLVNAAEEMAKGNLCVDITLGTGTKKNLDKIEKLLSLLTKIYYESNYSIDAIHENQRNIVSRHKEIALFFITDASGKQIYNTLGKNFVNNGDRDYFIKAKETRMPQISNIVISKITDKLAIVVAVPYYQQTKFMGVFAATIDMQRVSTIDESLGNAIIGTAESLKKLIRSSQHSEQQLRTAVEALLEISKQSAEASESVAASSLDVARNADEQLSEVVQISFVIEQSAAKIQEILVNAQEINRLSKQANESALVGEKEVNNAIKSMVNLEESSKKMNLSLNEINKSASKMDEILKTIQSIADQTNLLALNASIEAARAGEAGKGFAVVADEIRKLAEGSKESTIQINELIKEIKHKLDETNHVVNEDTTIVKIGTQTVNQAGNALHEIIDFVNIMNHQVSMMTAYINEVAQGSQSIVASTNVIQDKSQEVTQEIQNVSAAAEEQTAAMQEIAAAIQNLTKLSKDLQTMTNQFKI